MDELRVGADRDVVEEEPFAHPPDVDPSLHTLERGESAYRIVAVETEVAREVVSGAERDADERQVALDRDLGKVRQRSVAPGDPHWARGGPCELGRIVAGFEDDGGRAAEPVLLRACRHRWTSSPGFAQNRRPDGVDEYWFICGHEARRVMARDSQSGSAIDVDASRDQRHYGGS